MSFRTCEACSRLQSKTRRKRRAGKKKIFSLRFWHIVGKIYQDFVCSLFPAIPLCNRYPFSFPVCKVCKRIQWLRSNFATLAFHVSNYDQFILQCSEIPQKSDFPVSSQCPDKQNHARLLFRWIAVLIDSAWHSKPKILLRSIRVRTNTMSQDTSERSIMNLRCCIYRC